jgi:hypothetical protein
MRAAMKKILGVYNASGQDVVGDGFPVRSLFSYNSHGGHTSMSKPIRLRSWPARHGERRSLAGPQAVVSAIRTGGAT